MIDSFLSLCILFIICIFNYLRNTLYKTKIQVMSFQDQNSQKNQIQDAPQQVDVDPGMIFEKLDSWVDGFIRLLPNIGIAIVLVIIFYFAAKFIGKLVEKTAARRDRENLGSMLGGFAKYAIIITGVVLGMTVIVPSLNPGDLIAGLGVSSVAIGFAFKDILQNWMAGLLILLRQPFEVKDQIEVDGYEGTVEKIETRATIIKTYGGERIVIPNNQIYTNSIKVKTAHENSRSQYDIGIGYGDDMDEAIEVLKNAVSEVEGVNQEKGVEVLPWDLAASWVTLRVRWWTGSQRSDVVKTMVKVIPAIKKSLDNAKIDMPYETKVQLMHDQTEATDGDRSKQREGWPANKDKESTTPAWKEKIKNEQSVVKESNSKKVNSGDK